jgi:hypothetical protein
MEKQTKCSGHLTLASTVVSAQHKILTDVRIILTQISCHPLTLSIYTQSVFHRIRLPVLY